MLYKSQILENYNQNINIKDLLKTLNANKHEFNSKNTLVLFSFEYIKYLTSKHENEVITGPDETIVKVVDTSKKDGYSYELTFKVANKLNNKEKDTFFYLSDIKTDNPEFDEVCFEHYTSSYDNCCYMLKYNEQNQIKNKTM